MNFWADTEDDDPSKARLARDVSASPSSTSSLAPPSSQATGAAAAADYANSPQGMPINVDGQELYVTSTPLVNGAGVQKRGESGLNINLYSGKGCSGAAVEDPNQHYNMAGSATIVSYTLSRLLRPGETLAMGPSCSNLNWQAYGDARMHNYCHSLPKTMQCYKLTTT